MVDLDDYIAEGEAGAFYTRIGALYASGSLSITDHRTLAEWFGSYCYILPAKRIIHMPLQIKVLEILAGRSLFDIACRVEHLSVTYSSIEQQDILRELEGEKTATLPG